VFFVSFTLCKQELLFELAGIIYNIRLDYWSDDVDWDRH